MIICIVLAILLVLIIGYAAMNDGRLWGEPENYKVDGFCKMNDHCNRGQKCVNNRCK